MPSRLNFPISNHRQLEYFHPSKWSHLCVLPHVPSHPRWNYSWADRSPLPRDQEIGHDPSLASPIPGHHRPCRWSKSSALRIMSPGRKHRTASSLHCHITQCRTLSCTAMLVKQYLCLHKVIVLLPARRYNGLLRRLDEARKSQWTSHFLSAHEQLNCYVVPHLQRHVLTL